MLRLLPALILALQIVPALAEPALADAGAHGRLDRALGVPDELHFELTHRTRFEPQRNPLHADGPAATEGALFLRTTALLSADWRWLGLTFEGIDARAPVADPAVALSPSMVNPTDVLQANARLEAKGLMGPGSALWVHAGRLTLDLGGRRLLARNRFRNTINAFTGVDAGLEHPALGILRLVTLAPVRRLPREPEALQANDGEPDETSWGVLLAGLHFTRPDLPGALRLDASLLALHERDSADRPTTRDRRHVTASLRLFRAPAPGRLDAEVQAVGQFGRSRATSAAEDTLDLAHRAGFVHLAAGFTLPHVTRPRLALMYDLASGDADPKDGINGRFDTLFGARRFELGPTGTFGLLARSNLESVAVRVSGRPLPSLSGDLTWRPAWLAQAKDAWTSTGLRDPSGRAGRFIGHQLDSRVRWQLVPRTVRLEGGAAWFWFGAFPQRVGPERAVLAQYGYLQLAVRI